ncbi:MAG: hypothetical protein NTX64_12585 [Elusimicrobia bacterium]|nr:hypothetical protein [Elusimicrobiota bacterium]
MRAKKGMMLLVPAALFWLASLAPAREAARIELRTHEVVVAETRQRFDGMAFPAGTRLVLTDQQRVITAFLGGPETFQAQLYQAGTRLDFFGPGIVSVASLASSQTVHGMPFDAQAEIRFDSRNGKVESVRSLSGRDMTIQGIRFSSLNASVRFHPNEKVKEGRLAVDQTIEGARYRANTSIMFHATGKVESGVLAKELAIGGVRLSPEKVGFFEDGKPSYGKLVGSQVVQGYSVQGIVQFHPNGGLDYVCLAEDRPVRELLEGRCCRKGEELHLDESGKPIGWGGRCRSAVDRR